MAKVVCLKPLVMFGPLAGPVPAEMLLEQRYPRSSAAPCPDIMALRGKRLVGHPRRTRDKVSMLAKWLLPGGDTLTGRYPFGRREVKFEPTHNLLMLTNFRPQVDPEDNALWERIHLVEFKISFVDRPTGHNQHPRTSIYHEL